MADPRDEKPEGEPSVKVTDRRRFAREGEAEQAPAASRQPPHEAPPAGHAERPPMARPSIDFSTFVLSLASTALIQMGAAPDPETGRVAKTPELARETIDLLGMLREKTRGNLTDEETRFFDALLYDLRMRFIESSKEGA